MKAKKISMLISISLFILGILFAFLLTATSGKTFVVEWEQLLVNLSIGISTGGLVALLIEIPLTHSLIGANKSLLTANSLYAYMYSVQLTALVDTFCADEKKTMFDEFGTDVIKGIVQFAMPLLNLDSHMYFCKTKQKQISAYVGYINGFLLTGSNINNPLKLKMTCLEKAGIERELEALQRGERYFADKTILSSEVRLELLEMKNNIKPLCDIIINTMNLVLSKKELKHWVSQITVVNDGIYSGYEKLEKSGDKNA